jgi:hypothetical protein
MSENTAPAMVLPNLDRKEVIDRLNNAGGENFFDFDAYGTYKLALTHFLFEPGKKKNPHFVARATILESTNANWPVGRECAVFFHTNRPGTATDPGRPDRDDEYLAAFIRAVFKIPKGQPYAATKAMQVLLAKGKLPDQSITFRFVRRQGNTVKQLDRKSGLVNDVTYPKDAFEIA